MMKLLKTAIIIMTIGCLFVFPTVKASELTTEPTTEITTENTDQLTVTDAWEQAKTWVVGSVLSLFSAGMLSVVAYIIINKGKKKIEGFLDDAVAENKISRATADKLIDRTNDIANSVYHKVDDLETKVVEKLDDVTEKITEVIDSQKGFYEDLESALTEYMEE